MTEYVIDASNVSRHFGDIKAIQNLDLQVKKGCIYGFLGPNGSGKTTAIRLLTGLLRANSGSIEILGHTLPKETEKLRRRIGYMTQKFSLYEDLRVSENLSFIADIYGLSGKRKKQRISELMDTYDLEDYRTQLAGSMSGGQRQRLSLAAAVLHQPDLLFLDEPTSAVDPENRRDFWEQLFDLSDNGTTILVSTHYMDEAERCHKLAILDQGIKRADGAPEALMKQMGASVVEVSSNNIRALKQKIMSLPDVISAAQLGARLRVLIKDSIDDPKAYLKQEANIQQCDSLELVRPSLEDVFVTSTREQQA